MVNRGCEERRGEVSKLKVQDPGQRQHNQQRELWFAASSEDREVQMQQRWEELLGRFLSKAQSQRAPQWAGTAQSTAQGARLSSAPQLSSNPQQSPELSVRQSSAPAWGWWWCCLMALSCWELRGSPGSQLRTQIWPETLWNKPPTAWFEIELRLK